MSIVISKPFFPPIEEYQNYISKIWENGILTNNGTFEHELQNKLKAYFGVKHLILCSNGTIALQLAIRALEIKGEIITTPLSYVATLNSIIWENCTPVFVDINSENLCIDSTKIEAKITSNTKAILATHLFGHSCDIDAIEAIANKHNVSVIYDGAHAFGTQYKQQSVLKSGTISTCSFHATKLFHTIEGGCIITDDDTLALKISILKNHGMLENKFHALGTNARLSEVNAAMGLCNLNYADTILKKRKQDSLYYQKLLEKYPIQYPLTTKNETYNYAYFPLLFSSEIILLNIDKKLKENQIFGKRYFYPSLNTLEYVNYSSCPVSEEISKRMYCLPINFDMSNKDIELICSVITSCL